MGPPQARQRLSKALTTGGAGQDSLTGGISAIDINSRVAGDQGSTFVGDNADFSGADQVRIVADGFTIARFESNGHGVADFELQLGGNLNLTAVSPIL